jgi:hypothetical protein
VATTQITWNWGTNTNINFDAATDILDFGWFRADQFTVSEVNGTVVIAIPVNIMAMDYGTSVDNGGQMGLNAINAAIATEKQISNLGLSSHIGVTAMIGVNDVSSEVFTLADAQALLDYAQTDSNIVRLSMWSVARDNGKTAGVHYASPDSSGIAQHPYDFSAILHHFDLMA